MISHFVSFVKPLNPQTAPVPISERNVAPWPWKALPQRYAQPESFVGQVRPTLAALPAPAGFELARVALPAQPQDYAPTNISAPTRFGLIVAVPPTIANWLPSQAAPNAQPFDYAQGHVTASDKITLAPAPSVAGWLPSQAVPSAQPQEYAQGQVTTSDKIILAPAPSAAGWLPSSAAASAQPARYAKAEIFVAQVRPTLAALPAPAGFELMLVSRQAQPLEYAATSVVESSKIIVGVTPALVLGRCDNSQVRQGGTPPVPKHYVASVRQLLPAPAQVAPLTVAGWLTNDARNAMQLEYAPCDSASPTLASAVAPPPVGVSFTVPPPPNAQPQEYALTNIVAPEKPLPVVPPNPFIVWRAEDAYVPKFDWYAMGDTLSAPAFVAVLKQAYASAVPGQPALPRKFDSLSSTFAAPQRFGLTQTVLPTLASWTATEGARAVSFRYAGPEWSAPAKFGIVVTALPTIASWLATLGEKAVQLRYEPASWTAPAKFALAFVAATPTVAAWTSTIGAPRIALKYASPEFASQVKPTLATLPIGIALAEPAATARPQVYASVDWTGPSAAQAAGAAVLEATLMRVFSALQALGGFSTFSAAEVTRFLIVSK